MGEGRRHRDMSAPVADTFPAPAPAHGTCSPGRLPEMCCCTDSTSSSGGKGKNSSRRKACGFLRRVTPLFSRKRTRQSCALVLLFLAGAFSLRGWRAAMMIESAPFGRGRWTSSSFDELDQQQQLWLQDEQRNGQCWEPGGPVMFEVQHSDLHDATDWSDIAESFIARRSDFKEYLSGMAGTDVYVKDSNKAWNSRLTPMTRLLVMAGLTGAGARAVHFVDGNHASFSFPAPPARKRKKTNKLGIVGAGGLRGGGGDGEAAARPTAGQVGVLRLDDVGHKSQFVVHTEQPLPYRLTVSAPVSPTGTWARGAGRGAEDVAEECVKFAGMVGGPGQERPTWFPGQEDPRELLRALDNFCPISWLRKEQQTAVPLDDGDEDNGDGAVSSSLADSGGGDKGWLGGRIARGLFATVVGGPAAAGKMANAEPRNLVIYQRDRNRRLLDTDELMDELWERLGHIGWTMTEIIHDDERHPCYLIEELAGADVLLTAHGFQSMLSLFMAPGSVLFEVYPHKFFETGYAPMAQSLGLRYGFSESPPLLPFTSWLRPSLETCMKWSWCRNYVRRSDVVLDKDSLEVLISLMLESLRAR